MSFKYQQLGQRFISQISQGHLNTGDALPSVRRLSEQFQVSISTASQTYQWLEQQGFIYAKPQSGYYVKGRTQHALLKTPPAHSISVTQDNTDLILDILQNALIDDAIGLSCGFLDPIFRPTQALQRALNRNAKRNNSQYHGYGNIQGELSLRTAIAEHMQNRHSAITPEQILITNGCLEAVVIAIQTLTKVGDVIAVFSPCYSGLLTALQFAGRKIIEIPCGPNGPNFDTLEQLFQLKAFSALLFSATATNPIGFTLSTAQKQQLADFASRYQIWLFEDDTFGCLHYHDDNPSPVYSYDQSGFVVYCSSFSKELAPNLRIGWIASRSDIHEFTKHKLALNISCPMPTQLAIADYLFHTSYNTHIKRLRADLQREMLQLQQAVTDYFPQGTRMSSPQGGFFLWVELPEPISTMQLFHRAKAQKIYTMPGEIFTMTSLYKNCMRLSANQPWNTARENAMQWLGQSAGQLLR